MAFVTISPHKGTPTLKVSSVTVSWRQRGSKATMKNSSFYLGVYIGQGIAKELGWTENLCLLAAYCPDTNRLRLERTTAPAEAGQKRPSGFAAHVRNGTICVNVPLAHVFRDPKPAATVHHAILQPASGPQLVLTLPPWAWEAGKQRAREARDSVSMQDGIGARAAA